MKSYLSLVPKEAKAHRRQNRMTVLCIVIAVFLVTGVFSLCNMAVRMEYDRQLENNGNWHIMAKAVDGAAISDGNALRIMSDGALKTSARYGSLNYDLDKEIYIGAKPVCIVGADESFLDILPMEPDGAFPSGADELMLSRNAAELYDFRIGDSVTLTFPEGEKSFELSGFVKTTEELERYDCFGALVNMDAYRELCGFTGTEYNPTVYMQFKKSLHTRRDVDDALARYGISDYSENPAVMGMSGSSSSDYVNGLYLVAAFIVLLVMLAGVLMIAGSMNTNISRRTQFFGMLRCIGAGKDQIKRIVRREALSLCVGAVPVGVVTGILASWGVGALLRYGIGGEWEDFPAFMVSGIGIAAGVLIGIVTVLLASSKPARKASSVSPILAVSGNSMSTARFKKAADSSVFKIDTALGIHHARSSGRNLLLMTGSFALSIVLFLSFSVIVEWIGFALNTMRPYTPELSVKPKGYENSITAEQLEALRDIPGILRAYGRMYVQPQAACPGKDVSRVDLISYDEQQFEWAEDDLVDGDISRVMNEKNTVMTVFDKVNPLTLGDIIEINGQKLEIAATLSDSPFSTDEIPIVICSENTFTALTGNDRYAVVDIHVTKDCPDDIVGDIRALFDDSCAIGDDRAMIKEVNNTYYAFVTVAYSFLAMIALISVFNIINSISMSVTARLRQCGVMRAVGMDERQLVRMISGEAFFYCLCGIIAGCVVGLPMNALFYDRIITHYFGRAWSVPLPYLLVIVTVVLLAGGLSIYGPAKRIREMTVTETINSL